MDVAACLTEGSSENEVDSKLESNGKCDNALEERTASDCEEVSPEIIKIPKDPLDKSDPLRCLKDDSSSVPASAELEKEDAYFYTKREEFTSELFKVAIKNLPKYAGFKELRKVVNKVGVFPKKIKFGPNSYFAFMSFGSEEERKDAIDKLNGHKFRGRELQVKPAKPKADPFILKRKAVDADSGESGEKKMKNESIEDADVSPSERLLNSVTPLWNVPYSEQLQHKEKSMRSILEEFTRRLSFSTSKSWVKEKRKENDGICCTMQGIKPSPVTENYRNKVEFNIGKGIDGEVTVGFRTGSYKGGHFGLVEPSACINITEGAKEIAKCFQEYLKTSKYPPYDVMLHSGYWRQLTVRSCRSSQTMIIIQIHPQQLDKEQIEEMKESLRDLFTSDRINTKVGSLYLQMMGQRRSADDTLDSYMHVSGSKEVEEQMIGMSFRISPDAFFQVNTAATEVLYSLVKHLAVMESNTVILDICCGTGTIALSLAKETSQKVFGFELCKQAVEDARHNAAANGITNVTFVQGKAEDTLYSTIRGLPDDSNIVAVVDPPRAGLHNKVIQCIRRCALIKRLIYVSCNPKLATNNFVDLCRDQTRRNRGTPFQVQEAYPVDLFPHTEYCELVLLFTRSGACIKDQSSTQDGNSTDEVQQSTNTDTVAVQAEDEGVS